MQKSVLLSKTFWFGVLSAVAPLIPAVGDFVSKNLVTVAAIWGLATVVLRFITKDKVVLID